MSVNSVTLVGNLVSDMDLRATPNGYPIGNLRLAVNERRRQPDGSYSEAADFFDAVILGDRASKLQQYLGKGTKVAVQGKLRQRTWVDKETGKNRSAVEVLVDEVEWLSRQGGGQQEPYRGQQAAYQAPRQAPQAGAPYRQPYAPQQPYQSPQPSAYQPALADDEIPFN